jgi:manganese/zinc/iron transport system permease protein
MMESLQNWSPFIDGWIVTIGVLGAVAASLPGNFLVLRRMSMLGDAISHAVLPGLAAAFFISASRNSAAMFIGAVIAGVLTALFTELIRNYGDVDEGASMGVVFTTLFALGLVMIVRSADHVDLDPSCVLYGAIELTPLDIVMVGSWQVPRVAIVLSVVLLINVCFVAFFYKELAITAFDPSLADTSGISSRLLHYLLMVDVAVTSVACFESVGNILVVAMMVVPPAAACMLTERLGVMIVLSAIIAAASACLGHVSAMVVPHWFGFHSASTAGMMALCGGLLFMMAALFAPKQGVLVRMLRRRRMSFSILCEDVIALLYRMEERGRAAASVEQLKEPLFAGRLSVRLAVWLQERRGQLEAVTAGIRLTSAGRQRATELVRSHRLWEHYLATEAGVAVDRLHGHAERFEHVTGRELRDRLATETTTPVLDPHGRPIPAETDKKSPDVTE